MVPIVKRLTLSLREKLAIRLQAKYPKFVTIELTPEGVQISLPHLTVKEVNTRVMAVDGGDLQWLGNTAEVSTNTKFSLNLRT